MRVHSATPLFVWIIAAIVVAICVLLIAHAFHELIQIRRKEEEVRN